MFICPYVGKEGGNNMEEWDLPPPHPEGNQNSKLYIHENIISVQNITKAFLWVEHFVKSMVVDICNHHLKNTMLFYAYT